MIFRVSGISGELCSVRSDIDRDSAYYSLHALKECICKSTGIEPDLQRLFSNAYEMAFADEVTTFLDSADSEGTNQLELPGNFKVTGSGPVFLTLILRSPEQVAIVLQVRQAYLWPAHSIRQFLLELPEHSWTDVELCENISRLVTFKTVFASPAKAWKSKHFRRVFGRQHQHDDYYSGYQRPEVWSHVFPEIDAEVWSDLLFATRITRGLPLEAYQHIKVDAWAIPGVYEILKRRLLDTLQKMMLGSGIKLDLDPSVLSRLWGDTEFVAEVCTFIRGWSRLVQPMLWSNKDLANSLAKFLHPDDFEHVPVEVYLEAGSETDEATLRSHFQLWIESHSKGPRYSYRLCLKTLTNTVIKLTTEN